MKLKIKVDEMSKKISSMYNATEINKSLHRTLSSTLLIKDYKTLAIYLYKRNILNLDPNQIAEWLDHHKFIMPMNLIKSFKKQTDNFDFSNITMYIIKNDHIEYFYNGDKLHNVLSHRKELRK